MEPLGRAVIARLIPQDIDITIYNDRLEPIPYDIPFDVVAISVQIFTARRSYEIATLFRKRGVPVALGVFHVTLVPNEAEEYADTIILGDAQLIWPTLVNDLRRGTLQPVYACHPAARPQNDSLSRGDLFIGKKYLPVTLLQFSRGCTQQCNFCATSVYFQKWHYVRDVAEVVREIKAQKRKLLFFVDDNIVADKTAAKELFRALIPLKIRWVSQASMDMIGR